MKKLTGDVWHIYRARIPWLLFLLVSAIFTGGIITAFESSLTASVVLTASIPMLMGTGGNSGSQSFAAMIRLLATKRVQQRDIAHILWREFCVALLCAVTLSIAVWIKLLLVDRLLLRIAFSLTEAAVITSALAVTVVLAKLLGCALPLAAKRIGWDPAVMTGPLVTTTVDILSLLTLVLLDRWW